MGTERPIRALDALTPQERIDLRGYWKASDNNETHTDAQRKAKNKYQTFCRRLQKTGTIDAPIILGSRSRGVPVMDTLTPQQQTDVRGFRAAECEEREPTDAEKEAHRIYRRNQKRLRTKGTAEDSAFNTKKQPFYIDALSMLTPQERIDLRGCRNAHKWGVKKTDAQKAARNKYARILRKAKYHLNADFRAQEKRRREERGRPFPRGTGGHEGQWNRQGRQTHIGDHDSDGVPWDKTKRRSDGRSWLQADHIWSVKLLKSIGITDKRVINTLPNMWIMDTAHNVAKSDTPLHIYAESIGHSPSEVAWYKDFALNALHWVVKAQQQVDPSFALTEEQKTALGL